jgi:hypothetical protein
MRTALELAANLLHLCAMNCLWMKALHAEVGLSSQDLP